MTYILNAQKIGARFLSSHIDNPYTLGYTELYPKGLGKVKLDDIEITDLTVPMSVHFGFFSRIVDTQPNTKGTLYAVQFEKQLEGNVYTNATILTPVFTLKAPKVKILESRNRVKFILLARAKTQSLKP